MSDEAAAVNDRQFGSGGDSSSGVTAWQCWASLSPLVACIVVALVVYVLDWGGILLTREAGRVASIWFANAFVLTLLPRSPNRRRWQILMAAALANIAANLSAGDNVTLAVALALCNSSEVLLALVLLDQVAPELKIDRVRDQIAFVLIAAVLAPAASSALAALALWLSLGTGTVETFAGWFPADSLGMMLVAPLLLSLRDINPASEFREIMKLHAVAMFSAVIAIALAVFWQTRFPALFVVLPPLVLVAFVSGFVGSAASTVAVSVIAIGLTIRGRGPILFVDGTMQEKVFFLQAFLVVAVMLTLPIASIVAERRRLVSALRQATAAAQRASKAKTDFLATMSHEIRTPLNCITGFTQIVLSSEDLSASGRRKIGLIQQASSALVTIVDDVLDFSKIEAGRITLKTEPFSLLALIDNSVSIVRPLASAKGLEIGIDLAADLPRIVIGDENRLRQVLLNLLSNAIKFTHQGQIKVSVHLGTGREAHGLIHFQIKDTRIGIPKTRQSALFERFSQVDSSISRQFGGTGLGLSISRQIVTMMGGEIGAESEPGFGSTFRFSARLPSSAIATPIVIDDLAILPFSARLLLLVEDVTVNQEVAIGLLSPAGHLTDVVSNGLDAIAAVQRKAYDAVLMDIQMPELDGVETCRRIRALPGAVGLVPVIALTANVLPDDVARFHAAGMNAHVGKPFKQDTLLKTIDDVTRPTVPVRHRPEPARPLLENNLAELHRVMGESRVLSLLSRFHSELEVTLPLTALASHGLEIQQLAHKYVSQAGMLGFPEFSAAARTLEETLIAGADAAAALLKAEEERQRARGQLADYIKARS